MSWIITGTGTGNDLLYSQAGTPSLDLRFASTKSLTDYISGSSLISFTRASSATYVGSDGLIKTATTNEARFDHNPTTGESLGLLMEQQRTNLLLNSTTLTTQNVTVTAVTHTLSFYGTGTVSLSGAHSATVVGTGVYPARSTLIFTPTAGTLTVTVNGTVEYANLEIGGFATSWIFTGGSTATRSADAASISGSNLSSWYLQREGTVFTEITSYPHPVAGKALVPLAFSDNSYINRVALAGSTSSTQFNFDVVAATVAQRAILGNFTSDGIKSAGGYKSTGSAGSLNGAAAVSSNTPNIPLSISQLDIANGHDGSQPLDGHIKRLTYWPHRLSDATIQSITQ